MIYYWALYIFFIDVFPVLYESYYKIFWLELSGGSWLYFTASWFIVSYICSHWYKKNLFLQFPVCEVSTTAALNPSWGKATRVSCTLPLGVDSWLFAGRLKKVKNLHFAFFLSFAFFFFFSPPWFSNCRQSAYDCIWLLEIKYIHKVTFQLPKISLVRQVYALKLEVPLSKKTKGKQPEISLKGFISRSYKGDMNHMHLWLWLQNPQALFQALSQISTNLKAIAGFLLFVKLAVRLA